MTNSRPFLNSACSLALAALLLPAAHAATLAQSTTMSFDTTRPQWGVQVSGSVQSLGNQAVQSGSGNYQFYPISVESDYQPVHWLGVLGIGPELNLYPTRGTTPDLLFAWSWGGHVRYQARFSERQAVVPTLAYSLSWWNYRLRNAQFQDGGYLGRGPTIGAWIDLGFFDPTAARMLFHQFGIARSYLTAELRVINGGDDQVNVFGHAYHFGIRFEL